MNLPPTNYARLPSAPRRDFLRHTACGFGSVALASLLADEARASSPLAPKATHFAPRAKRVVFVFLSGGPSHIDLFDHKPRLNADHGKRAPFERDKTFDQGGVDEMRLHGSPFAFDRHGRSGIPVSELLPQIGGQIDDICVLNGMHTDSFAHAPACLQLHTGSTTFLRPSLGAWVTYGLGTPNRNLPGFLTIAPSTSGNQGSVQQFGSAFLPAIHQGTPVRLNSSDDKSAGSIKNLGDPRFPARLQRRQLDFIQALNRDERRSAGTDQRLEGMIESFELAFRMQAAAPEVFDLSGESEATKKLYGIGDGPSNAFGRQCLLARRLAEAGVRFIQVNSTGWDHHSRIGGKLPGACASIDKPVAGLIQDLKGRGLFEDTLIVVSGEFGRTPFGQDMTGVATKPEEVGRGHSPVGYTTLLAGGGVKGGHVHGATDEFGYKAVDGKVHLHDLHATILYLLGIDHERLTYRYAGRDFRLTDVYGEVVREILT